MKFIYIDIFSVIVALITLVSCSTISKVYSTENNELLILYKNGNYLKYNSDTFPRNVGLNYLRKTYSYGTYEFGGEKLSLHNAYRELKIKNLGYNENVDSISYFQLFSTEKIMFDRRQQLIILFNKDSLLPNESLKYFCKEIYDTNNIVVLDKIHNTKSNQIKLSKNELIKGVNILYNQPIYFTCENYSVDDNIMLVSKLKKVKKVNVPENQFVFKNGYYYHK